MASNESVKLLLENESEVFKNAAQTLLRIFGNVTKDPANEKYRKVKLSSKVVSETLLPCFGAMECLFDAGFIEDESNEYLVLPMEQELSTTKSICDQISAQLSGANQLHVSQMVRSSGDAAVASTTASKQAEPPQENKRESQPKWPKWKFPTLPHTIEVSEMTFYRKLKSAFDHVLMYEDLQLQEKARSVVPQERLKQMAAEKFESAKADTKFDLADFYIIELMDWYREDFFRWVNAPDCERCEGKTQQAGMGQPNSDDIRWGAGRVELYRCTICSHVTRFPRYNHPGKLLETRRGRCGEWANCFTLICRAFGYEARHVLDWTDHVWTEVFSHSQQRWLHCDPGEKALDRPLLYEAGWGKKLTYVIAFSKDEINDVTWRYTADHQALILRRTECREKWLLNVINSLRIERHKGMSDVVKKVHQLRLIKEGAEFIGGKKKEISAGEMIGRQTGSLQWRESRGETGDNSKLSPNSSFTPNRENLSQGEMTVTFCSSTNSYTQSGETKEKHDWKTCIFEGENIQRNVEIDWNMVYLARTKLSSSATISWKFDLSDTGKSLESAEVYVSSQTFHSGCIQWSLEDSSGKSVSIQSNQQCCVDSFKGSTSVVLKAHLSEGDNGDAWQHTQLFRQKRGSKEDMMKVTLKFS